MFPKRLRHLIRRVTINVLLICLLVVLFMYIIILNNVEEDLRVSRLGSEGTGIQFIDSVNTMHPMMNTTTHASEERKENGKINQVDKHGCEEWFEETFEENLDIISNYPKGIYSKYTEKLGGNRTQPKTMVTSFPVIATAASSGFYMVSQGLLKSIHEKLLPKYKQIKIIYYDLGLKDSQYAELVKYCKCEVRRFPFDDFPEHVNDLSTYTWKPIIVKMLLIEFGWVWWMDSSVRFITSDLDRALKYSRDNSILFLTYGVSLSVARQTAAQTMKFLSEDTCKFRYFGEIEATFLLFHFDRITNIIVDKWTSCAINRACMAPTGDNVKLICNINDKSDGRCHRYDQAVISILLRRLYHDQNDYPLVDTSFHIHEIRRGEGVAYFAGFHDKT